MCWRASRAATTVRTPGLRDGAEDYACPIQWAGDFFAGRKSQGTIPSSYPRQTFAAGKPPDSCRRRCSNRCNASGLPQSIGAGMAGSWPMPRSSLPKLAAARPCVSRVIRTRAGKRRRGRTVSDRRRGRLRRRHHQRALRRLARREGDHRAIRAPRVALNGDDTSRTLPRAIVVRDQTAG